jgi:iron donor protein CyaY
VSKTGRLHHEQLSKGSRCGNLAQSLQLFVPRGTGSFSRGTFQLESKFGLLMDDQEFKNRADQSLEALYRRLAAATDGADFEVDFNGGALAIEFEEPPGKFVISPNAPVHQIWVSAHSKSLQAGLGQRANDFVLPPSRQTLTELIQDAIAKQLGEEVSL